MYHQLKQEHFITIKLKLIICYYPIVLAHVDYNFYTKTETDTLLADELINIGDISLPGMLDIGTSAYTNSRIRCNADIGGYTGYAELRAANYYDMFLNLSATRTDGGWMYFKINNDDHIQLSGSDSKVNVYKHTSISGTVSAQQASLTSSDADHLPLVITRTGSSWFLGEYIASETNSGCLFKYQTAPGEWWTGVWGANTNRKAYLSNQQAILL